MGAPIRIALRAILTLLIFSIISSKRYEGTKQGFIFIGSNYDEIMSCNGKLIKENDDYVAILQDFNLIDCSPQHTLKSSIINTSIIKVAQVHIMNVKSNYIYLQDEHFKGLISLKSLELEYGRNMGTPRVGFLDSLTQLTEIVVSNAELPPMPTNSVVENAFLNTGRFTGSFGGCKELKNLTLSKWEVRESLELTLCHNLKKVYIEEISPQSLINALAGVTSLEVLTIRKCYLQYYFADLFVTMHKIIKLDLQDNIVSEYDLDISSNSLQIPRLDFNEEGIANYLPKVQELSLERNKFLNFCYKNGIVYPELKKLTLADTNTDITCINIKMLPVLQELHMENYKLPLNLKSLLNWPIPLDVYLQDNSIKKIIFTQSDYETVRKLKLNITIYANFKLMCDCQHAYIARALRENLITFKNSKGVICMDMDHMNLKKSFRNQTECTKTQCGECVCRRMWSSGATTADCQRATATRIPRAEGLQTLLAPDNRIQLREEDIPDTLTHLDLTQRQNYIFSIEESIARKLFSVKNRTILLAGNKVLCNCDNKNAIEIIKLNYKQVLDYENLICEGEKNVSLRNIEIDDLCIVSDDNIHNMPIIMSLILCSAFLIVITLSLILNYFFGQEIRVFLYSRGWCLACFKEDDDLSRSYDVFVSFCHQDELLVCNELVPRLEELGYKVYVHYRDWNPGELIPTQIVRSVEVSRRTIVILSKNFIYSQWGSLEFKTAHSRALKDGVARVILIVLDDVIESENLDEDIRSYTRTNTYVKWGDPWFWDKLQYALRRRRGWRIRGVTNLE